MARWTPCPGSSPPSLTQVGLGEGDLMKQCRQDLHGTLDPLPRHFTCLPNPGWSGEGGLYGQDLHGTLVPLPKQFTPLPNPGWSGAWGSYEAVQIGPARYPGPLAQAIQIRFGKIILLLL
jgi:hypothetical protein